jgi:hypothetical protein
MEEGLSPYRGVLLFKIPFRRPTGTRSRLTAILRHYCATALQWRVPDLLASVSTTTSDLNVVHCAGARLNDRAATAHMSNRSPKAAGSYLL